MYRVSEKEINQAKWPDLTSHFLSTFTFHTDRLDYSFASQLCLISYPQQTCKFISLAGFLCRCPASMSSFRAVSRGRAATKGSFCSSLLRSCLWPTCLPLSLHFSAASQTRRHRRKHWTSQGSLPSKPQLTDERWREGKRSHTSTLEGIFDTFHNHGNFQTFCSLLCGRQCAFTLTWFAVTKNPRLIFF